MRISDWSSDVCSSDLTVRVGDDFEREQVSALIMITVYPKQMPAVVEALRQMPEVRSLQSVSGIWALAATGVVPTIGDMDALTDRIGAVDGVVRTTSSLVLTTKFERCSGSTRRAAQIGNASCRGRGCQNG